MEIKTSSSASVSSSEPRSVQASRRSGSRNDEREAEFSSREVAQHEHESRVAQSVTQGSEARFFAIDSRDETQDDPRLQVRAMRERVRQTYSEQESSAVNREIQKQLAQDVSAEKNARHNEARNPIDLIA